MSGVTRRVTTLMSCDLAPGAWNVYKGHPRTSKCLVPSRHEEWFMLFHWGFHPCGARKHSRYFSSGFDSNFRRLGFMSFWGLALSSTPSHGSSFSKGKTNSRPRRQYSTLFESGVLGTDKLLLSEQSRNWLGQKCSANLASQLAYLHSCSQHLSVGPCSPN